MTKDDIVVLVDKHKCLVEKAIAILSDAPYWTFVGEPAYAALAHDDGGVFLEWPEDEMEYDSSSIRCEHSPYFDPALLSMPEEELKAWKKEQRKKYDKEQKEKAKRDAAAAAIAREQQERAILAALTQKYGQ